MKFKYIIITAAMLSACSEKTKNSHPDEVQAFNPLTFERATITGIDHPITVEVASDEGQEARRSVVRLRQNGVQKSYLVDVDKSNGVRVSENVPRKFMQDFNASEVNWRDKGTYNVNFDELKTFVEAEFYMQAYRCRSSQFWPEVMRRRPDTRKLISIHIRQIMAGVTQKEALMLLTLDVKSMALTGMSVVRSSENLSYGVVYVSESNASQFIFGDPGDYLLNPRYFAISCYGAYLEAFQIDWSLHNQPYLPAYNFEKDPKISKAADKELKVFTQTRQLYESADLIAQFEIDTALGTLPFKPDPSALPKLNKQFLSGESK